MRLALCQINATVGDIAGNSARVGEGMAAAFAADADLVLFPELVLTGYPPEDLLLKEHFLSDARVALEELAVQARGIAVVVGFPERAEHVYNSAALLAGGAVHAIYRKVYLPNYGVFDERRYFHAGPGGAVVELDGHLLGLTVCEDIWEPGPPASEEALAGASLIVNISASPYHAGKGAERERMLAQRARDNIACVAFCGLLGGQDELVFDGHSCVIDHNGRTLARASQFSEEMLVCDIDLQATAAARPRDVNDRPAARARGSQRPVDVLPPLPSKRRARPDTRTPVAATLAEPLSPVEAEIYAALELGLRDYVEKNDFRHVVLGLSGGIDSALVACLAADALGSDRVDAVIMPSPYSSSATQADARGLASKLAIGSSELPIAAPMAAYEATLATAFKDRGPDLTEENLQARIRGNLLMALSNKFGWLVLTTGNKSEMSVGYTTLYGDLAGGFAVIKDVPKTLVYRLCEWRNSTAASGDARIGSPIPRSIIERAPSAELRHDQRDDDSLPSYQVLDQILEGYVELDRSREQLLAQGLGEHDVDHAIRLVDLAEYKRRQAPPGIKISARAFGRDRRVPITNRYRG